MADPSAPSFATPANTLVGREREQATLRDALATALAGRGSLVLIGGEAGIGKTALAEATLAEAADQGALVLVGRCYDLAETPPYGPWTEVFAPLAAEHDLPAPVGAGEATASQAALVARVRDHLGVLAARRPLVLLLDDLHWADPASLDLLRVLGRHLATLPLLLLVTYRSDELTRRHPLYALLPTLVREARAVRLDPRPLDAAGLGALVARYALPPADAGRLVAYLAGRAEGNPLFAGELLRALEETLALRQGDDGWQLGDLAAAGVPPLLRQVLDARLDRLGEDARGVLEVAAVVGQEVPFAVWQAVAGVGDAALLAVVERATAAHLLAELPDGRGVRFAHALVREALYAGTPGLRRRMLHRRAGERLLAAAHPDPDAVAHHLRRAGDPRAVEWLTRASHRAGVAGALVSAAERAAAAVALLGDDPGRGERRGWLLYRLGFLARLDAPRRALGYLEEAGRLAAAQGNPALALMAQAERGFVRAQLGQASAAEADLTGALAARARLGDAAWQAGVARGGALAAPYGDDRPPARELASWLEVRRETLALLRATLGRYAEVLAQGEALLPPDAAVADGRALIGDRFSSPGYGGNLAFAVAHAHAALGRPAEALALFLRANQVSALGHTHLVGARMLGDALLHVTLPYRADQVAERSELAAAMLAEHRRSLDLGVGTAPPEALRHALDLVEGDWAAAERGALALRDGPPVPPWAVTLGTLARWRGEREAARGLVRAHLPDGPATAPGAMSFLPALALIRLAALLAVDAAALDDARAWLACHARWLAWSGAVLGRAEGMLGWAAYHRAADDLAQAHEHAKAALAHASGPRQPLALLAAHRLLGELDTDSGEYVDAAGHLAEALRLADVCAAPYERALCLLARAALQVAVDKRDDARATLTEARALLEPLAAKPALARADALAAALDAATATTAAAAPTLPAGLSAREAEVLRLVAQGHANADIAARLFLSPRTVTTHLTAIYGKLGVENRAAAVAFAIDHGLR